MSLAERTGVQHAAVAGDVGYRSSVTAKTLLFAFILLIGISPRIGLPGVDAEIRVQDLLVPVMVLYLLLSPRPRARLPMQSLIGPVLPLFLFGSVIVLALSMTFMPEISLIRRVAYYGRTLEIFVIATCIAGLYLRSGPKALTVAVRAVQTSIIMNAAWVLFQTVTGTFTTLVGQDISSTIESYGPKLIGEPSPFGVGQYWAFAAAITAALVKNRVNIPLNSVLLLLSFYGALVAESRISVGAIVVVIGLLLVLGPDKRKPINIAGTFLGTLVMAFGFVLITPLLGDRFSRADIEMSVDVRVNTIWIPDIGKVVDSPIFGVGPGGLVGVGNQTEAHNFMIRALVDFGFIVGTLFILFFLIAMVRSFNYARSDLVDRTTRLASYMAFFTIVAILVSGLVQDSLTAVMPSHLIMTAIGLFAGQRARWEYENKK